ncbi:MAG: D-2-hydroxyacid dehydrogenase [Clostridiales Family XIII bacterium]|jgi:glycerate dehydrogenase|nr:D-2-hydroxyacid dehydrogenase [Clostridiales Family XIII bacterium]
MKIVVLDGYNANPGDLSWEPVSRHGDFRVYDRTAADETVQRIGDAEIVLVNKATITRDVMDACPSLRYVGVLATGYNVVDTEAARERGVAVTNIPAYSTASVAQHSFALLLELCHRAGHHSDTVMQGRWQGGVEWCYWDFPLVELDGKTLGIVGFGRIGQATARIARAFGMEVIVCSRSARPGSDLRFVGMDELFAASDVITLHCPLTEETRGLIRKENIDKMKRGVRIINTARGPLVVDGDLAEALRDGRVSGAGLDVLTQEPPRDGNPLIGAPNCIITPHMAWAPIESRARLMEIAGANIAAFISGRPVNVVNP